MQGQRGSLDSFSEAFEYDRGTTTSNSVMNQQGYWSNVLLDSVEPRSISDYLLPSIDANESYENLATQSSPSTWHSGEPSSSTHLLNESIHDDTKMEHVWSPGLRISAGSPRTEERQSEAGRIPSLERAEERQSEAGRIPSLERADINLNSNVVDARSFPQTPDLSNASQSSDQDSGSTPVINPASEIEPLPHPDNPTLLPMSQCSSTSANSCEGSCGYARIASDDDGGRSVVSLGGRRLPCKRKNIEGVPEQSSTSGGASFFQQNDSSSLHSVSPYDNANASINISGTSNETSMPRSSEEQQTERFGSVTRGTISDSYPSYTAAAHGESSQRNLRMRISRTQQHDSSQSGAWGSDDISSHSNVSPSPQPSSQPVIFNPSLDARSVLSSSSSEIQHQHPIVCQATPNVPFTPCSGPSSSRAASSSNLGSSRERLMFSRQEMNSRSMPRNHITEHSSMAPPADARAMAQDPTYWSLADIGSSSPGNDVSAYGPGSNSSPQNPVGPNWVHQRNPPPPRRLVEVLRRSLFSSGGSDRDDHSSNVPVQSLGNSVSSQEIGRHSGVGQRGNRQIVLGPPSSLRSPSVVREGRNRVLLEIRNAFDLMRRAENIRFEEVFILDHPAFHGGGDLHDRHRDMRLDVDNMSYEELLALEERIGNVSTGLAEEKILKCLKQRVYSPVVLGAATCVEPCSICQEEYIEGEDLGTLDCGHDFHSACIKQWLMHKNLCPICRTTGLLT